MTHYFCPGCGSVSDEVKNCDTGGCGMIGNPMRECHCEDGIHAEAMSVS